MSVNVRRVKQGKVERVTFGKCDELIKVPPLLEIQKKSYKDFLLKGIKKTIDEFFPITDYSGKAKLYITEILPFQEPKYDIKECKRRGATYSAPLKVKARFVVEETGQAVEQEVFLGDVPMMTDQGSFIFNGIERVVINQIVRAPSVYMTREKENNATLKAQMIPVHGTWIEIKQGANENLKIVLERKSVISLGVFLKCFGFTNEEIIKLFGENRYIKYVIDKETQTTQEECLLEFSRKTRPTDVPSVESTRSFLNASFFTDAYYNLSKVGRYKVNKKLALRERLPGLINADNIVVDGEILVKAGEEFNAESADRVQNAGVNEVWIQFNGKRHLLRGNNRVTLSKVLDCNQEELGIFEDVYYPVLKQILNENNSKEEALKVIKENAKDLVITTLTMDDILATISVYLDVLEGFAGIDKIEHLSNKRVATVGELTCNAFRSGVTKLSVNIKETLQGREFVEVTPSQIMNPKAVNKALRDFFSQSQLSQIMDQKNPLSGITQKRRVSAIGPGGIKKERADPEIRDIHYTHYGRICPIETPEGQSIGLLNTLATYVRVNDYGFLETPYRVVDKERGVVTKDIVYKMADVENDSYIAQAIEPLDEEGHFINSHIICRHGSTNVDVPASKVDYMDVSPKQLISVATSLIPFVSGDEANRALMGANMQRQAVPVIRPEAPIVGTGMEAVAAHDSGCVILAKRAGKVSYVSADEIRVLTDKGDEDVYTLIKFAKANDDVCFNQRPCVVKGESVQEGDVLTDGYSTENGELAVGKNVLIGYMNWEGQNFEDAILINERLVKEDVYTSITLYDHEIKCRTTKLGDEAITRDIPNLGEDALKDLDENGIIRIGAEVQPNDILVGKVTPKGETDLTPEERLLRAIFGDKARDVRDTSLRVQHGKGGVVVDVQVFSKKNKDDLEPGVNMMVRVTVAQKRKISVGDKMSGRHGNKGVVSIVLPEADMPFMANGQPIDIVLSPLGIPSRMNIGQVMEVHLGLIAKTLGWKVATPAFDGATMEDIKELLVGNNFREDGKIQLYDGRTGEPFDNLSTVGVKYMLKLEHMVDSKIHARSIGPYALITQQPLGGKSLFGGQRFGEMEVWALEAYGASHILQEMLTVKSDDLNGRLRTYESIIKGLPIAEPGIPESFKVLVKELQALGLDVKILAEGDKEISLSELSQDEQDQTSIIAKDTEKDLAEGIFDFEEHLNNTSEEESEEVKEVYEETTKNDLDNLDIFDDFGDFDD